MLASKFGICKLLINATPLVAWEKQMAEQAHNSIDWNGKLSVVNGSPLSEPYPLDRDFWAVLDEGLALRLRYWPEGSGWAQSQLFTDQDGDGETYDADQIMGWTDSRDDAEEAAALLMEFVGVSRTIPTTCIETIGGDPGTAIRLSHQIKVF
jgi:hypothetical protein